MNRRSILVAAAIIATIGGLVGYYSTARSEAQRNNPVRFEYAVINGNYLPYPADNPSVVSSAANICYLQAVGCQNEEIRIEINLSKFAQDERLVKGSRECSPSSASTRRRST